MSRQLAVSTAFAVLMMACFVLFGTPAAQMPRAALSYDMMGQVTAPDLPAPTQLLPFGR